MTLAQSIHMHTPIGSASSQEIDVELFAFIERYATNLVRWDVLLYFGQNPNRRDPASDIAGRLGRKPTTVQKELDDLAYLGVVHAEQNDYGVRYSLATDINTRRAAMRLARDVSITR